MNGQSKICYKKNIVLNQSIDKYCQYVLGSQDPPKNTKLHIMLTLGIPESNLGTLKSIKWKVYAQKCQSKREDKPIMLPIMEGSIPLTAFSDLPQLNAL